MNRSGDDTIRDTTPQPPSSGEPNSPSSVPPTSNTSGESIPQDNHYLPYLLLLGALRDNPVDEEYLRILVDEFRQMGLPVDELLARVRAALPRRRFPQT
jgi:hypothetical protein